MASLILSRARLGTGNMARAGLRLAVARHCYSTAMGEGSANLPLAGYRVLDMTRVLAGVSCAHLPSADADCLTPGG